MKRKDSNEKERQILFDQGKAATASDLSKYTTGYPQIGIDKKLLF